MTNSLRVALLGYGLSGRRFHAPLLKAASGISVAVIVTSDEERRRHAKQDFPNARILNSSQELWASASEIDLVVIASPSASHVPLALMALKEKLHVVVEKPIAGTAEQALLLSSAAELEHRQVHTFQNRRWDSDFLTLCQVVAEGTIGAPHRLESRMESLRGHHRTGWRHLPDPTDMGGVLLDLGSHMVDQAIILMGPVVRVFAQIRDIRRPGASGDDAVLVLTHRNDAVSVLVASWAAGVVSPRFVALGDGGGLRIDDFDSQESALRSGRIPVSENWGLEPPSARAIVITVDDMGGRTEGTVPLRNGQWNQFYPAVRDSIMKGAPAPVPLRDVIANMRVLDAARISSASGTVITLDPPASHIVRVSQ